MTRRAAGFRVLLLIAAACLFAVAVASGAHVHQQATADTVNGYCPLCALGQVRSELAAVLPALSAWLFAAWLVVQLPPAAPSRPVTAFVSPRAPPLR